MTAGKKKVAFRKCKKGGPIPVRGPGDLIDTCFFYFSSTSSQTQQPALFACLFTILFFPPFEQNSFYQFDAFSSFHSSTPSALLSHFLSLAFFSDPLHYILSPMTLFPSSDCFITVNYYLCKTCRTGFKSGKL